MLCVGNKPRDYSITQLPDSTTDSAGIIKGVEGVALATRCSALGTLHTAVQCSVTLALAVALCQAHYMNVSVNVSANVSVKVDVQENAFPETMEACTYT